MTSFSDSEFNCESNGGTLVIRRLSVPEIDRPRKRGVAPNLGAWVRVRVRLGLGLGLGLGLSVLWES
jgi:hypothetical protein